MNEKIKSNERTILATAILVAFVILASVRAFAGPHEMSFDPKEKKVSLKADKAKVKDILDELATKSGVEINADREIAEEISIDLPPTDIEDGIRQVLDKAEVKDWDFGYYFSTITNKRSFVSVQLRDYETPGKVRRPERVNFVSWITTSRDDASSVSEGFDEFSNDGKVKRRIKLKTKMNRTAVRSANDIKKIEDERVIGGFRDEAIAAAGGGEFNHVVFIDSGTEFSISENGLNFVVHCSYVNSLLGDPNEETHEHILLKTVEHLALFDMEFRELFRRTDIAVVGTPYVTPGGKFVLVRTYGFYSDFPDVAFSSGKNPPAGQLAHLWLLNDKGEKILEWNDPNISEIIFSPKDKYLAYISREDEGVFVYVYDLRNETSPILKERLTGDPGMNRKFSFIDEESRTLTIEKPYQDVVSVKF